MIKFTNQVIIPLIFTLSGSLGGLIIEVRGQTPGPLQTRLASLFCPDVAGFDRICPPRRSPSPGSFGAQAAHGWTGSSRFRWKEFRWNICRFGASFGIFRGAVGRPEGAGTDQPGAECRVAVAIGPQALKGRHKPMHRLSRPFRASSPQWIGYPGRRRRSQNSRRLALG